MVNYLRKFWSTHRRGALIGIVLLSLGGAAQSRGGNGLGTYAQSAGHASIVARRPDRAIPAARMTSTVDGITYALTVLPQFIPLFRTGVSCPTAPRLNADGVPPGCIVLDIVGRHGATDTVGALTSKALPAPVAVHAPTIVTLATGQPLTLYNYVDGYGGTALAAIVSVQGPRAAFVFHIGGGTNPATAKASLGALTKALSTMQIKE